MKRKYKVLIGIVLLLIAARLVLPYVVLRYANKTLAEMNGYYGHIDDVDLFIYRGAYTIKDMYLNKVDSVSGRQTKFFTSRIIDLSIEWPSVFHGALVGAMIFNSPELIFTKDKAELGDIKKDTNDFRKLLKDFMPLKVNRFETHNGAIHYIDNTSKPRLDVSLQQAHILALNLTNVTNNEVELPSTVTAEASVYEGTLKFKMKLNAMTMHATFDLNAEVKNANLVLANDFLQAYGDFDVSRGELGLYTEMAAKNGGFKGYVKPVIKNLKVVGPEDRHDSFFQKLWEYMVAGAGVVFKNPGKEQIATKIPIEGDFKNPEINTTEAVWEVLRNAFIQAIVPRIDNEITIHSVKTTKPGEKKNFLKKIFSSGKKKENKKHK